MTARQAGSTAPIDPAVLDALGALVIVVAPDGRILNFNRACTELSGYAAEEVEGRSFLDVLVPEHERAERTARLAGIQEAEFPMLHETTWVDKQGGERLIAWTTNAIRDADGEIDCLVSTGVDVTATRAAEGDAAQIRAHMEEFLDHAPAAIFLRDADGRYMLVNRRFEEVSGRSRDEVIGRRPEELWSGPEGEEVIRQDREALRTGAPVHHQYTLEQDGDVHNYLSVKFLLNNLDGTLAGIGGIATDVTDRVRAAEQLEASYRETLTRLARAVELRDKDTGGHIERMSAYCELIARRLGIDAARAELVRSASTMHDAGKIAIPDSILLSPRRLTVDERALMETHAAIGHDLLAGSSSPVLQLAASIAYTHHERYDGSGYPRKIAGDEIPLEGRIAAVADVFDAVTSDRPYRPALSVEAALELMQNERGTQFDPVVLDAFVESISEVRELVGAHAPARPPVRVVPDSAAAGKRIVVIDQDDDVRTKLRRGYERQGALVSEASTGADGVKAVYDERPDLVVVDVATPDIDGWALLTRIRDLSDVPAIMLSTNDAELEKVRALRHGFDDHMTKPVGIYELLARSEALIRRERVVPDQSDRYVDSFLTVDFESAVARADGRALDLTPLEFRLLAALVRHPDQVLSANQLLAMAWGDERLPRDRVTVYVRYLRAKFSGAGLEPPIETVRGFGYRYRTPE
jgi:PAS domain S-box-containing protein